MICPGCRTLNFRDYKYCRECGRKLDPPAPASLTLAMNAAADADDDEAALQQFLETAFREFDAGNYSTAALACQGALAIRPESTAAHSLLGLVYERQGEMQDAIQQYRIVLDLNPSSRADRAKLNTLLRQTGQARPSLFERVRQVRTGVLAGGVAAVLVLVTGLLALARSAGTSPEPPASAPPAPVQTALVPSPATSYPPAPSYVPPPTAPSPPATGGPADFNGFPRRTMSNTLPPVTHVAVAAPYFRRPRSGGQSPPTFLAPAPIRGVNAAATGADLSPRPAGGPVPILPDPQAEPTAGQPAPASPAAPGPTPPVAPPAVASGAAGEMPGSSISIRRLDPGAAASTPAAPPAAPAVPPPTLAEARYHFGLAVEMRRRGDLAGAYREYEYARELFSLVNNRGGTEGLLAAEGALASHRAMQQLSAGQR
jgi:tetratricopeptide (TPR) repeat protein